MSDIPAELRYLSSHEWIRVEDDGTAYVGITDHAQDSLGDLVFVELPEVGDKLKAGEEAGVVESVKAASELINNDPYGDGWIYQIRLSNKDEWDELLTAEDYATNLEAE